MIMIYNSLLCWYTNHISKGPKQHYPYVSKCITYIVSKQMALQEWLELNTFSNPFYSCLRTVSFILPKSDSIEVSTLLELDPDWWICFFTERGFFLKIISPRHKVSYDALNYSIQLHCKSLEAKFKFRKQVTS